MEQFLSREVINGKTVGDVLTIDFLASAMGSVLAAMLILFVGFVFAGWANRRIGKLTEKYEHLDKTLFGFLGNIVRYVILGFTILFVLNSFGVQTTSVVAVIGAAGLAIGLALQGTLSNIAAGVMIILFRPFNTGDFVEIDGQKGSVMSVTLNFTELAALGNIQTIIPNAKVWGNTIVNYSAYDTRRAEWSFGVGYGANLADAEQVIRQVVGADPRTMNEPEPFVQVNYLGESSVDFLVHAWVRSSDYFTYQADMKRKVKEALDAAGVDIPFPTRTVLMAKEG